MLLLFAVEIKIMEATYRHTKQVPVVGGQLGSLRSHSLNSPTDSGQNYIMAGFISFTAIAGTPQSRGRTGASNVAVVATMPLKVDTGTCSIEVVLLPLADGTNDRYTISSTHPTDQMESIAGSEPSGADNNQPNIEVSEMLHKDDVAQTLTDMETLERIHNKPTVFIADPDCPYCHGTGIRCIPCGPDDYDREVCDCQPEDEHEKAD